MSHSEVTLASLSLDLCLVCNLMSTVSTDSVSGRDAREPGGLTKLR
jgi:hypothetical protein